MATQDEIAVDEILARLKEQWDADTPAIIGSGDPAPMLYDLTEWKGRPDNNVEAANAWGRVTVVHDMSWQATLTDDQNRKRYRNTGLLTVQVFAPYDYSAAGTIATRLARVVKVAFQGRRTDNVTFGLVRVNEIGREGAWYQINVSVEFHWDEVR